MALSVKYDLLIEQVDVISAFLQSDLEEQIFMEVPGGIQYSGEKVCLLLKSLYGLKQSPRAWNQKLHSFLITLGFTQSKTDYCVYYLHSSNIENNFYVLIFVDNILLITKSQDRLNAFKTKLKNSFEITDAQPLSYFLGICFDCDKSNIYMFQKAYLEDLLEKANMDECRRTPSTPLEIKIDTDELTSNNTEINQKYPCRNIIGSLMYAMLCTRPDLCYAV